MPDRFEFDENTQSLTHFWDDPVFQLTDWDQVQIGDVVHSLPALAGGKERFKKSQANQFKFFTPMDLKDTTITTSDIRNLRSQTDSARAKRPEQPLRADQTRLFE